jgi:hypothetical protein
MSARANAAPLACAVTSWSAKVTTLPLTAVMSTSSAVDVPAEMRR